MRVTPAKLLILINIIIFLFILFDTTAIYDSDPFGSQNCCPRDIYEYDCELCKYETCCEYTYLDYNFALIPYAVFEKPWTLVTVMFLHADFWHIFYNMLALVLFGLYLEKVVGWKNFLFIYFTGGVIASIIYVPFAIYFGDIYIPSVGASGAIYAVIIALMIIRPYDTIFKLREKGFFYDVFRTFLFLLEGHIYLFIIGLLYLAVALSGIFVDFLMGGQSGVANAAHLGGAVAGIIFGFYFRGFYATDQDVERYHRRSERHYQQIAREEGARVVRMDRYGRFEYVDGEKDDSGLEIEESKKGETQGKKEFKPGRKNSDDELEIID